MAKQKEKSSRSRAAIGKRNSKVGKDLERQIATDLRQIMDHPDLVKETAEAKARLSGKPSKEEMSAATKEHKRLLKLSAIRRGEQGRGAHEPDVVTPTDWWLEIGRRGDDSPLGKLAQAQRDSAEAVEVGKPWRRPVAVVRKTGSPKIKVALELAHLLEAAGDGMFDAEEWVWELPVVISYKAFLKLVEDEHARQ